MTFRDLAVLLGGTLIAVGATCVIMFFALDTPPITALMHVLGGGALVVTVAGLAVLGVAELPAQFGSTSGQHHRRSARAMRAARRTP